MRKVNKKELNKKQISALLAGTIALTSVVGCSAKTNTTSETTTAPVVTTTTVETTVTPTPTPVEVTKDMATVEYMNHAKAVANAMYDANKEFFIENDYTAEDLENVYYVINSKYYDNEKNLIMDLAEFERSNIIIENLFEPSRYIELAQKQCDVEKGYLSFNEYMDEVNASTFYDYSKAPLTNFIDVNEDNRDIRNYINEYSIEMYKTTENLKNCVSYEDHMIDFFSVIRSAQTGDITNYKGINNYLQETSTDHGYGYIVACTYESVANMLNVIVDGEYVTVPLKKNNEVVGEEDVRISLDYDEQMLVNAYYHGDLVETEDIIRARKLIAELFQTMPNDVKCYKEVKEYEIYNAQPVKGKARTL